MTENTISLKILNKKEDLGNLLTQFDTFLRTNCRNPALVNKLTMCIDELVTNIISYGYPDKTEHNIEVSANIENNKVMITLKDDGIPFDPTHKTKPNPMARHPIEKVNVGGLGIHIVTSIMDAMEYQREEPYNILKLTKSLS
jgi:anti-sigma regulatory factor (Ser/Thr protein kinase)